jgi:predicted DNA binding protein
MFETDESRMISARFRIRLPDGIWVTDVSTAFPRATFRLLSGYKTGDSALELGETITDTPDEVVETMRSHPSIHDYELLETDERRVLGRYETTDTNLYEFVESASLTIEFPVDVQNGFYEFSLTATREELEGLRTTLDASGLSYELLSLTESTDPENTLTDRQREVLETAVREGYFEVPRECTLAELAETLDIDKSTASTILRRGEAELLKSVLGGPTDRTG